MANRLDYIDGKYVERTDEQEATALSKDVINAKVHREHRNKLLARTDWLAGSDVPSSVFTDEWKAYRQALRDLTKHSNWPHLEDSNYPTKPS
tara:strand:- start:373 stop:648 length:276 start_codon:yes stop_codon:yes gene_type:complete